MDFSRLFLDREKETHKGNYGHVFVVGGSIGLTGAVCLVSNSALRAGAGLVTAGIPEDLNTVFEIKLTEVMTFPLAAKQGRIISDSFSFIEEFIKKRRVKVLALGPGLSVDGEIEELINKAITKTDLPLVLDADGINGLAANVDALKDVKNRVILTPHLGEFSRLTGESINKIKENRKKLAKEFAFRYNLVLVLKGSRTIVTDGEEFFENNTGNPGMATAGAGDVLTGIISGLVSQLPEFENRDKRRKQIFQVAQMGVHLHGLAGDIGAEVKTQGCLTASDIMDFLPEAVKREFGK